MSSESNHDRVAIVTGAAGEIGQAIAKRFAKEGYQLAVTDLANRHNELEKLAGEIRELGAKIIVVTGDITVEKDVEHIVQETVRNFGSLQVVCLFHILLILCLINTGAHLLYLDGGQRGQIHWTYYYKL